MLLMMMNKNGAVSADEDAAIDQTGTPLIDASPGGHEPAPFNNSHGFKGLSERNFTYLPDPTVGGRPAPGQINSANQGPAGNWRGRHRDGGMRNAIGFFPPIQQGMQGNVGRTRRTARQYAGVLDQLAKYDPTSLNAAASLVGIRLPNAVA